MPKKPESRLHRRIKDELLAEFGGWWRKIWGGPFQVAGLPDLIGVAQGLFFGLEVKMPGRENRTSELQWDEIEAIREAGGYATVVSSVEEATAFVRRAIAISKSHLSDRALEKELRALYGARHRKDSRPPRRAPAPRQMETAQAVLDRLSQSTRRNVGRVVRSGKGR